MSEDRRSKADVIETTCPNCGQFYKVGGYRAGWQVRCKDCRAYFQIPELETAKNRLPQQCEFCSSRSRLVRCRGCSQWGCASCVYRKKDSDGMSSSYTLYYCHGCHMKELGIGVLGCAILFVVFTFLAFVAKLIGLR